MTKKEEVIEIAKTICVSIEAQSYCSDCFNFDKCRVAEVLYNAGWHKCVTAKWTLHKDGSGTCSECHCTQKNVWDYDNYQSYCGHCGAKMNI